MIPGKDDAVKAVKHMKEAQRLLQGVESAWVVSYYDEAKTLKPYSEWLGGDVDGITNLIGRVIAKGLINDGPTPTV